MQRTGILLRILILATCSGATDVCAQAIQSLQRASLSPDGNATGTSYSYNPTMDGSGRYVVFTSTADDFAAPGKVTGKYHEHVYLRDTWSGVTTQLDVTSDGRTGSPANSFNTNIRTFKSSFDSHLSRDGNYVVFASTESDISPDGQGESFGGWFYLKNLTTSVIQRIPYSTANDPSKAEFPAYNAINADGSKVVLITLMGNSDDVTGESNVWELSLYDRGSNTTTLLNTGIAGNKFNPGISDDGNFIVFENQVGNFNGPTYSYLYDVSLAQVTALNGGNIAQAPAISGDGNFVAYADTNEWYQPIRVLDRVHGTETVITRGYNGADPYNISDFPSLSVDGRYIAFLSAASNLVADDRNKLDDIFVFDRATSKTLLVSVSGACDKVTSQEEFNTGPPTISADGRRITFSVLERLIPADRRDSEGNLIEPADSNSFEDVYVADIDYSAAPENFSKTLTPAKPLVSVTCTGKAAGIQLEGVLKGPSGSVKGVHVHGTTAVKSVTQQVTIKKINPITGRGSTVKRLTARRNQITYSNLGPGSYSAQVQAVATLKNGKTSKSKTSLPALFDITE